MAQTDAMVGEPTTAMTPGLVTRLEEIPGVASVSVDLTDQGGGINVRLDPDADEFAVMERLRSVLAAYGVRSADPRVELRKPKRVELPEQPGTSVAITPLRTGARIEVASKDVRAFRVVPADRAAIAQGLADAWCQTIGKTPVEIMSVSVGDNGELAVVARDGGETRTGAADVAAGWEQALTTAVGQVLGSRRASVVQAPSGHSEP